jgi:hypothetical protein
LEIKKKKARICFLKKEIQVQGMVGNVEGLVFKMEGPQYTEDENMSKHRAISGMEL